MDFSPTLLSLIKVTKCALHFIQNLNGAQGSYFELRNWDSEKNMPKFSESNDG